MRVRKDGRKCFNNKVEEMLSKLNDEVANAEITGKLKSPSDRNKRLSDEVPQE